MVNDKDKKLILQANRNGFFYVIDRTNGKLVRAESYAKVSCQSRRMAMAGRCRRKKARQRQKGIECVLERQERPTGCRRPTIRNEIVLRAAREHCDVFSTAPQRMKRVTRITGRHIPE